MWASQASPLEGPPAHETLAAVAHELRLPLSHINGFVSSLRRDDLEWDEATRREFLADIELEADRLGRLVESLVEPRRPTTSGLPRADLAVTDSASIVLGALHRVRGVLRGRPLRVDVASDLPPARMDASQVERVLANLLQNAIKYTPAGTAIGISAQLTDTNELEFAIEDEGPGVPLEDRDRIFEPFIRSQMAAQSNMPGNGFGLAICQSIVRAHGGRMEVTDRPGGGARFRVVLPVHAHVGLMEARGETKERGHDPAEHSRGGRRGADAQVPGQQSQGQRLCRTFGGGRNRGPEADRRASIRSAAA